MAAIRNAEASGSRTALRAALGRAAAAPSNSARSNQLARLMSRHTLSGGGGGGGSGGSSRGARHQQQQQQHAPLTLPPIPGVPDAEVSDAWVAELMHATGQRGEAGGVRDGDAAVSVWGSSGVRGGYGGGGMGGGDGGPSREQQRRRARQISIAEQQLTQQQQRQQQQHRGGRTGRRSRHDTTTTPTTSSSSTTTTMVHVIMPDGTPCVATVL